jgi:hypothetical protein
VRRIVAFLFLVFLAFVVAAGTACSALDAIGPISHFDCAKRAPVVLTAGRDTSITVHVSDTVCVARP